METLIADYLSKLEFGELQSFKNMEIIPLLTCLNHSPKYLTLKEALQKKLLKVKEIDEGGSVPKLKVINKAKVSVLLRLKPGPSQNKPGVVRKRNISQ